MSPVLPLELCDFIIDIIAADRPRIARSLGDSCADSDDLCCQATLHACSLTCRTWVPRSRRHLYSHVFIPQDKISVLHEALAMCPSNGVAVQHLHVFRGGNECDKHELTFLLRLLPARLPNLTHVTLEKIDFSTFDSEESAALKQLHLFENVKSLRFYDTTCTSVGQFARLVQTFAPFDHLEVSGLGLENGRLEPLARIPIASLFADLHSTPYVFWICSHMDILSLKLILHNYTAAQSITCIRLTRNLRSLVLYLKDEQSGSWLFSPCKCLRHFFLWEGIDVLMLGDSSACDFPHLQRLELHIHDARNVYQPPISLPSQLNSAVTFGTRILRVFQMTALEHLLLHVSCYTWTTLCSSAISNAATRDVWDFLDKTLCLPQYETVRVCASASIWNEKRERWWAVPGEEVRHLLPDFASRNNADFTQVYPRLIYA